MFQHRRRRLRRATIIVGCCLALFAGIALARRWLLLDGRWLFVAAVPALLTLRRHDIRTLICLGVLFAGLGWWRGSVVCQQFIVYETLARQPVMLVGRATDDAVYGKQSQLTFGLDHMQLQSPAGVTLPGRITVAGFGTTAVYRGDEVQVSGKLYPTRGNSQAIVSFAKLRLVRRHDSAVDSLRRKFGAGLQSALPEPLASFGLGLLIGQRNTLPAEVSDMLLTVGLTHIIAVSGYNLTIIVEAARRLFAGRSKFQMMACCLLLISVFLLLTGNSPSIVRASIISMLSMWAWYYGRVFNPIALLLTAAAVTVIANPLYLWGNVSWYLSFLAFFGVVVVGPLITRRLYGDREPRLVMQVIIESLSAELMTLPYVLYIFGQMSTVSLAANVLVVALIPLAMLLCTIVGLTGMLLPALAGWLAWPARWLLSYMLQVAGLLSRIPHAFVEHIAFPLPALITWYGLVGFLAMVLHYRVERQCCPGRHVRVTKRA